MVNYCRVNGCYNRSDREKDKHYYRLPEIITREGEKTLEMSTERRRLWLAKLNQDFSGKNLKNIRVCSEHFVSGQRSALYDKESPDWVPTLNMDQQRPLPKTRLPQDAVDRFKIRLARNTKRRRVQNTKSDAAKTLLSLHEQEIHEQDVHEQEVHVTMDSGDAEFESGTSTQTDMTAMDYEALTNQLVQLQHENDELRQRLATEAPYTENYFIENDDKVKYYTGLSSYSVLMVLFNYLEAFLPSDASLSKFQCFSLVLMKLRLSFSDIFLSYQFDISASTVSRILSDYIDVMYVRLKPFVFWPDRELLHKTMPMEFRKHFGEKCAIIIDCFEVFIETPSSLKAKRETFSSDKHHHTVKFLIGITPQGAISFISNSWGGHTSDKHLTEHCGFMDNILPGDLILADWGFDIAASVGTLSSQIQAFTNVNNKISPIDLETSRKIANVRVHVERVLGHTQQKYTILNSTLPIEFLETRQNDDVPLIDKIALICCSLVNMCVSVVGFDRV